MRFYFAHPVNVYDTPLEEAILKLIAHCFPGEEVENPNKPHHQKEYEAAKAASGGTHAAHKGMGWFYDHVLPNCHGCVSMPFLDNRMGLGVAGETQKVLQGGKVAFLIEPSHELTQAELDAFIADPLNGLFKIRSLTEEEVRLLRDHPGDLKDNPPPSVVPHEETRLRTFLVYNGPKRPYGEAHKVKMPVPEGFYPNKK